MSELPAVAVPAARRVLANKIFLMAAPAMLLWVVVAAALAGAQAQGEACLANPTVTGCEGYTVHEAVLAHDLGRLCASAALGDRTWSGWPAACTLWHQCQSGGAAGAACSPMRLMQTACGEAMLTPGTPSEVCARRVGPCLGPRPPHWLAAPPDCNPSTNASCAGCR